MDRRTFIKRSGAIVAISGAIDSAVAAKPPQQSASEATIDTGFVQDGKIVFPNENSRIEGGPAFGGPPDSDPPDARVGFAVLGLGRLTTEAIIPAIPKTKHVKLAGLITGTPEKARVLAKQYGLPESRIYGYNDFDRIRDEKDIQAVYVVTPNSIHRDNVLACAAAGKHVLCEKPMASNSREAQEMIDACAKANRKLMIAYRMQYEPFTREVLRLVRGGQLGKIKALVAVNFQEQGDPAQWRLKKALAGGGALFDIGVYCQNTVRAIIGEEPIEVDARIQTNPDDPRFKEVEESVYWTLRFPSGIIASLSTSYAAHSTKICSVSGDLGRIMMDNAFTRGARLFVEGKASAPFSTAEWKAGDQDQFGLEMDHFSVCIRKDIKPRTPGEEGLADHKIFEAVYESAATGRSVTLPRIDGLDTTRGPEPAFD